MLIVHNATLVTANGAEPGRSLVTHGGQIVQTGSADSFQPRVDRNEFERVLDARRMLLVPGLINTHHHLYQSLTRCLPSVQNQRLFDWLVGLYPHWTKIDYQALHLAAKVSLCELLLHGATTTSDHHYLFPPGADVAIEAVLEAAEVLGMRVHLCRGCMTLGASAGGLPPDDCVEQDADALADCVRTLDEYHDSQSYAMRRIDLAPCSPFNVTREIMRDTALLARERGVLLHTHLAETRAEDAFCQERYGCRPLEYLEQLDWLGPDVYLAHCVQLTAAEIDTLASSGAGVVHCPTSNMRLASGIAPVEDLLKAGVRVGLGVDGSSSNDGGNLLREAQMALLAARVRPTLAERTDGPAQPKLMRPATALRLATIGGAALLNRPELGHLEIGAAADFALFNADDPALAGAIEHDPLAALLLCDAPRAAHVFVAGREVVRDGRITALDQDKLAAEFNALVERDWRGP